MRAGQGPALIMVPATISRMKEWEDLVDFAAQWFEVIFFELPGHGESTPFEEPFFTALVGTLVEQIADTLGFSRFNLMGFSFGGILAMQAALRLHHRLDRVMLIAPCLTGRAIQLSPPRRKVILGLLGLLKRPAARQRIYHLFHDPPYSQYSAKILRKIGRVEETIPMDQVMEKLKPVTLEILITQIQESLEIEFPKPSVPLSMPCYFAMSTRDPLLDYQITLNTLNGLFSQPSITELDYPFHQPPQPFTFDELNAGFRPTVEAFVTAPWKGVRPA